MTNTLEPDLGSSSGVRTGELIGNNLDLSNVCESIGFR